MKTPDELRRQLCKQWQNNPLRALRLLSGEAWPLRLPISKPTTRQVIEQAAEVQAHIRNWKMVGQGEVEWVEHDFRGLSAPIAVPVRWCLRGPSEWVAACRDAQIRAEFSALEQLAEVCTEAMRELLVRERSLWRDKPLPEMQMAIALAQQLEPGCAAGKPLRLLAEHGVDTKFFERHAHLLCRLLDTRFDGAASAQGLTAFLGAQADNDHWLLIKPLCGGVLPFFRLRVTDNELMRTALPASRLLVVENERCEHLLPQLEDCIAILGAGSNLAWLAGAALDGKQLYYWGDLDTWGLTLLARARALRPNLQAVMMTHALFADNQSRAVAEPQIAAEQPHSALTVDEAALYRHLQHAERGRLEQEFIPQEQVYRLLRQQLE